MNPSTEGTPPLSSETAASGSWASRTSSRCGWLGLDVNGTGSKEETMRSFARRQALSQMKIYVLDPLKTAAERKVRLPKE
jgi:hypothetical protein